MASEGGKYSLPAGSTSLERLKVKDDKKENCVICLKELNSGDDAARLPCCHVCHYHCILEWFVYNGTCPICRFACTSTAVSNSLAIVTQ
uniref:E3 ubiquitin-protein ligase RLIM n=1 Tax=Cajanus cajan TaxID=3821 RepID=A0A151S7P5_CAJCA|nr:E3 ubiquitin-protein ligase RLIM [Cajanus cajan]